MKIHLKLNGKVIAATLADNHTAQEFIAMLPLTITMHDLFKREKFGPLPRAISGKGTRTRTYEIGDIFCWAPGPDLAIFYRHDGQPISGGIHVLGKLDFGVEEFCVPGPIQVSIEVPASDIERTEARSNELVTLATPCPATSPNWSPRACSPGLLSGSAARRSRWCRPDS